MAKPHPAAKATDETIKETFESIVIAFILAFIFRAYVVEAFIIPTGSMAPTLLGRHFEVGCEQCGYAFTVDHAGHERDPQTGTIPRLAAPCPMCRYPQPLAATTQPRSGDRLLVQKYLYNIAEPQRWDVVVFRNPQTHNDDGTPGPKTNYIKRLVGLPNESLYLIDGNVYVKPYGDPEAPWHIARKTDPAENRHWEKIQRAVWQPIYHSAYVPLDHGRVGDNIAEDDGSISGPVREAAWSVPWVPAGRDAGTWELGNAEEGWRRAYRFVPRDGKDRSALGELRFEWDDYHSRGTVYPYNTLASTVLGPGVYGRQPIEDVRIAATVTLSGPESMIEFQTTARLEWEAETLLARLDADGRVTLLRRVGGESTVIGETSRIRRLYPERQATLELWFVDQQALVFVDGDVVLRHSFDVPIHQIMKRPPPADRPEVAIRVGGGPATLRDVELDRDMAYTPSLTSSQTAQRGAARRSANGKLASIPPINIRPGRYFVLGDNSPISNDGRFWMDVEPWIERNMFREEIRAASASNLQTSSQRSDYAQVVPRGLMVGRAFFIYFPAPYAATPGGRQVLPNFGDMRFVH
ncbi:MAG: S26 family signal peptidase [Planctomycetota bacterium]